MMGKKRQATSYGCQQNLLANIEIDSNTSLFDVLGFICSEANKLTNCAIYYARQLYFKTGKLIGKFDLDAQYKKNLHYVAMFSQSAQQTLLSVYESFRSYSGLKALFRTGELDQRPKLPNYRTKGGYSVVSYPRQHLKLIDGKIRIPLGNTVKRWFGLDSFYVQMPINLSFDALKELRIVPKNQHFYIEFVYHVVCENKQLDKTQALSIDPGLNNWLTCVSTQGKGFIVDGLHLKSMNQWYNKVISRLQELGLSGSERFYSVVEKRNRQVRDAINKAARIIINHCLENDIGIVVFGWNKGQKQECNMGRLNNQKFVQVPTARLKQRIQQLAERYGIQFVETEESYTSKSSFLDGDELPIFGEKPEGYFPSGKRVKRGLYRTAKNWLVNADANGAANILKKASRNLDLDLSRLSRGTLTTLARIKLWVSNPSLA